MAFRVTISNPYQPRFGRWSDAAPERKSTWNSEGESLLKHCVLVCSDARLLSAYNWHWTEEYDPGVWEYAVCEEQDRPVMPGVSVPLVGSDNVLNAAMVQGLMFRNGWRGRFLLVAPGQTVTLVGRVERFVANSIANGGYVTGDDVVDGNWFDDENDVPYLAWYIENTDAVEPIGMGMTTENDSSKGGFMPFDVGVGETFSEDAAHSEEAFLGASRLDYRYYYLDGSYGDVVYYQLNYDDANAGQMYFSLTK